MLKNLRLHRRRSPRGASLALFAALLLWLPVTTAAAGTGALTFVEVQKDGVGGVDDRMPEIGTRRAHGPGRVGDVAGHRGQAGQGDSSEFLFTR